jgi:hypothetical protein
MNNTKTLAIVAIFMTATLVVGTLATTTTVTQSALAYSKNKKDNGKGNDNGNTITIQKCKQAATQSGFDNNQGQECENLICTHPGENATCVQEGAAAAVVTPVKLTCEQCFTKFLNAEQRSFLLREANVPTLEQLCAILPTLTTAVGLIDFLVNSPIGLSESAAIQLVQCLLDAGIVFPTDTDSVRTLR